MSVGEVISWGDHRRHTDNSTLPTKSEVVEADVTASSEGRWERCEDGSDMTHLPKHTRPGTRSEAEQPEESSNVIHVSLALKNRER